MITKEFIDLWEPRYDQRLYPVNFYNEHISCVRNAAEPNSLKEHLIALLHWKDGKANNYESGKVTAKPNMVDPVINLTGQKLITFHDAFRLLVIAKEEDVDSSKEKLLNMLKKMWWSSIVIPACMLHTARPELYPIIDQHTARAYLILNRGELVEQPEITWTFWETYVEFFHNTAVSCGLHNNTDGRCRLDRALFAWGKAIKKGAVQTPKPTNQQQPPQPQKPPVICNLTPSFWGLSLPSAGNIPTNANVTRASEHLLQEDTLEKIHVWEKQCLNDLQLNLLPAVDLRALLNDPRGTIAKRLLDHYKSMRNGARDLSNIPRPIRSIFLVGLAFRNGYRKRSDMATYLVSLGFGGTKFASGAIVDVGKTAGELFVLLQENYEHTDLYFEYFEINNDSCS
ncbi:MAG TPA: hypothetical protein VJZ49_09790 [Syntrophales bacterium]|nr:hypothetical protein [Syntrophales bacterium]